MSQPVVNSVIDGPSPPAQSPTITRVNPTAGCSARQASTSLSSAALLTMAEKVQRAALVEASQITGVEVSIRVEAVAGREAVVVGEQGGTPHADFACGFHADRSAALRIADAPLTTGGGSAVARCAQLDRRRRGPRGEHRGRLRHAPGAHGLWVGRIEARPPGPVRADALV